MESELNEWLNKLEKRNPTTNMLIWMNSYDKICDRICCYSTDCGSIKCSGCLKYLTTIPPKVRYQCMECEILPPETEYNPRPEICNDCFNNSKLLHNHDKWLKVDKKGNHTFIIRQIGLSQLKRLTIDDFPTINKNGICSICYESFDINSPAVTFPGCKKQHGNSKSDLTLGIIDSNEYNHANCLINWYIYTKRDKYCGEMSYCGICNFERDLDSWKTYFCNMYNKIKDGINIQEFSSYEKEFDEKFTMDQLDLLKKDNKNIVIICKENLIKLHPQEWIKNIIREIFI